ncbi:MAG: hypothetical protein ACJ8LG_08345 [Massilia sp.]
MRHTQKQHHSLNDDDSRMLWQFVQDKLRTSAHLITKLAVVFVILLIPIHFFYPSLLAELNKFGDFGKPSVENVFSLLVALLILERVFAIEEDLRGDPNFKLGPQDDLYKEVLAQLQGAANSANKVIFIQHSGRTATGDLCKLLRTTQAQEVILYQQAPECPTLEGSSDMISRITEVNNDLVMMDRNEGYRSHLKIKRFISPASIRALIIDDRIIVLSWYHYLRDDGRLTISGFENTGLYVLRGAPEFERIYQKVCKAVGVYEKESVGDTESLTTNITLFKAK